MGLLLHFLTGLHPGEIAGFVLFVGVVIATYLAALVLVIEIIFERVSGQAGQRTGRQLWVRCAVLGAAVLGVTCMTYGYFVEPYWPAVTHSTVPTQKLVAGAKPIRVVHISDLHSDGQARLEERLPAIIKSQQPDLIVFTGDAINSPSGLPIFRRCLGELSAIAPTFAVKGNWDALFWRNLDLFGKTGARELKGDAVEVNVRGTRLCLAGAPVGQPGLKEQALSKVNPEALSIFLYHYPSAVLEAARQHVDLLCVGHTHGGQVALPFYGAIITLSKLGKQYESGLYRYENTWLYVNRGIGMEGGSAPRIRFCARPEISVIDLVPADVRQATREVNSATFN
jgi:predicted MPP superfamily phosphohydrolase